MILFSRLHRRKVVKCLCALFLFVMVCGYAQGVEAPPFAEGETIVYKIKKLNITVGETTLTFNGLVNVDGQEAYEIICLAKGFNFYDLEKIYVDPETFYPIQIRRDLNIFGLEEKIVEHYDQARGKVWIVKDVKGEVTEEVLEQGDRFDNIYGFIYRHRQYGTFNIGETFRLHLPTRDVDFKLVKQGTLKVGGKERAAYFMNSPEGKYDVAFDGGPHKIPLMIKGAIGFGRTSMVMKEYSPGR